MYMKTCIEFEHHLIHYLIMNTPKDVRVIRRDDGIVMLIKEFPPNIIITIEEIINVMLEFISIPPKIVNITEGVDI